MLKYYWLGWAFIFDAFAVWKNKQNAYNRTFHRVPRGSAGSTGSSCGAPAASGGGASGGGGGRLEALDNLVISTIFSISTKLCLTSGKVIRRLQEQTEDKEHVEYLDTLVSTLILGSGCIILGDIFRQKISAHWHTSNTISWKLFMSYNTIWFDMLL